MVIPSIAEMFRHLINTPSVSCANKTFDQSNLEVVNHLANWLRDLAFNVEIVPLENDSSKANLIATMGSGEGGLILAGHSDTVPCDENRWHSSPYDLIEKQGNYYGLGTCDMKGFFPIAIAAAKAFQNKKLVKPLSIIATADEETSMAGARYLAHTGGPKADVVIIGEPTDMAPVYAHKGLATMFVRIKGSAGHASNPSLGNNALDAMHLAMGELKNYREALMKRYQNPIFEIDSPTISLGCLHAGDNPNRICENAELLFDVRLLPEMDPEKTIREMQEIFLGVSEATGTSIDSNTTFPVIPPYETPSDSLLMRRMTKLTGREPCTVAFGTEAPFYSELGMETIVFGPGSIAQAHQANEYLEANRIDPSISIIENLIHSYCCSN